MFFADSRTSQQNICRMPEKKNGQACTYSSLHVIEGCPALSFGATQKEKQSTQCVQSYSAEICIITELHHDLECKLN